ncbi:MAG: DUF4381 domain-containing protein [Pseudomonadota bacterium]|nr:DUF4381 domain-containing protein [Pseudomonadota bacterium]MEE3239205.1 DUF4381 domain-containing protein [Pseudomonadota bacterium]
MDSEELLAQLADIHLPLAVSYWPPAIGWWVLVLVLLAGMYKLVQRYIRYNNLYKNCQYALAELERCYQNFISVEGPDSDSLKILYINQFNSVLRRVALVHFPQTKVASLGGDDWVDFIRKKGDSSLLSEKVAAAISYGRFQTVCDVDVDVLNNLGHTWIRSLYLGKKKPISIN